MSASFALCPSRAWACDNGNESKDHCYAIATLYANGTPIASEGKAYLDVGCIGLPEGWANINTDEMWAGMSDGSWMEGGIITGDTLAGQYEEPGFFISDSTPGSKNAFYNEHLGGAAPVNTWNLTKLYQASPGKSSTWYGWTAGTGTITVSGFANNSAAVSLQAGLETSTNGGWNEGGVTDMSYLNANGNVYTDDWEYGSHKANAEILGPESGSQGMYFNWVERDWFAYFGFHYHGC